MEIDEYLTTTQAARELGVTGKSVGNYVRRGELAAIFIATIGKHLIHRNDLAQFKTDHPAGSLYPGCKRKYKATDIGQITDL